MLIALENKCCNQFTQKELTYLAGYPKDQFLDYYFSVFHEKIFVFS